jgi:hypothetical protein
VDVSAVAGNRLDAVPEGFSVPADTVSAQAPLAVTSLASGNGTDGQLGRVYYSLDESRPVFAGSGGVGWLNVSNFNLATMHAWAPTLKSGGISATWGGVTDSPRALRSPFDGRPYMVIAGGAVTGNADNAEFEVRTEIAEWADPAPADFDILPRVVVGHGMQYTRDDLHTAEAVNSHGMYPVHSGKHIYVRMGIRVRNGSNIGTWDPQNSYARQYFYVCLLPMGEPLFTDPATRVDATNPYGNISPGATDLNAADRMP